jgi:hypothetical protein
MNTSNATAAANLSPDALVDALRAQLTALTASILRGRRIPYATGLIPLFRTVQLTAGIPPDRWKPEDVRTVQQALRYFQGLLGQLQEHVDTQLVPYVPDHLAIEEHRLGDIQDLWASRSFHAPGGWRAYWPIHTPWTKQLIKCDRMPPNPRETDVQVDDGVPGGPLKYDFMWSVVTGAAERPGEPPDNEFKEIAATFLHGAPAATAPPPATVGAVWPGYVLLNLLPKYRIKTSSAFHWLVEPKALQHYPLLYLPIFYQQPIRQSMGYAAVLIDRDETGHWQAQVYPPLEDPFDTIYPWLRERLEALSIPLLRTPLLPRGDSPWYDATYLLLRLMAPRVPMELWIVALNLVPPEPLARMVLAVRCWAVKQSGVLPAFLRLPGEFRTVSDYWGTQRYQLAYRPSFQQRLEAPVTAGPAQFTSPLDYNPGFSTSYAVEPPSEVPFARLNAAIGSAYASLSLTS